jgi:hypothetical protein
VLHHQEAPSAGLFELFGGKWAGYRLGVKPIPFIFNANLETIDIDTERNSELSGFVTLIAMLDGIDECLFKSLEDIDHIPFLVATTAEARGDVFTYPVRFASLAWDNETLR